MERITPWWGAFTLAEGEAGCWTIGPTRVRVEHHVREWRVAYRNGGDPQDLTSRVELALPLGIEEEGARLARYSFGATDTSLEVEPLLADRPVVSHPEIPLFVPPQQSITLYVSSPLWLQVRVGNPSIVLQEMAIVRPSDTWSGPLTRNGGLCYASSTMARTTLQDFPYSPLRAVTPIRITNRAEAMVAVERLNLPVPYLTLYQAADGTLWTQSVELEQQGTDKSLALVQLGSAAPTEAAGAVRLAEPRSKADRSLLSKAFGSLFGIGGGDDGVD